jgi:hypothetical protein
MLGIVGMHPCDWRLLYCAASVCLCHHDEWHGSPRLTALVDCLCPAYNNTEAQSDDLATHTSSSHYTLTCHPWQLVYALISTVDSLGGSDGQV